MENIRANSSQMAIRIHGVRYTMDKIVSVRASQRSSWWRRLGLIFGLGVIVCAAMISLGAARPSMPYLGNQNRMVLMGIMLVCLVAGCACASRPTVVYDLRIDMADAHHRIAFTNKYKAISFLQSLVNANEAVKVMDRGGSWADALNP